MIRYTAKDIVRRARQLADLENSAFISWNENMSLLNEAYTTLYQRVINHGDKYYLKTLTLSNPAQYSAVETRYKLPADFFQLESMNDAESGQAVFRKSANDNPNLLRYDIVNDEVVIYGKYARAITMRYYPVPATLAYPADDAPLDIGTISAGAVFDCCGNHTVSVVSQSEVSVYDSASGKTQSVSFTSRNFTDVLVVAGKNAFAVMQKGRGYIREYWTLYDYDGNVLAEDAYVVVDCEKKIYRMLSGKIMSLGGRVILDTDVQDFVIAALDGKGGLYWLDENGGVNYWSAGTVSPSEYAESNVRYLMCDGNGDLWRLSESGLLDNLTQGVAVSDDALSILSLDMRTGYGFAVADGNGAHVLRSFLTDAEIEYPNNFFVQCIAYMLAMAYKAKQNADSTQLAAQYEEALTQYYDSVGRDDYASPRIQNVYSRY